MFVAFVASTIPDAEVLAVEVADRHADAVINDLDPLLLHWVDADDDVLRVGVPRVRYSLCQYGRDVAVEIDAEVLKDVEVHGHLERRRGDARQGYLVHWLLLLVTFCAGAAALVLEVFGSDSGASTRASAPWLVGTAFARPFDDRGFAAGADTCSSS